MIFIRKATLKDSRAISELFKLKYSFATLAEAGQTFRIEFQQHHHYRLALEDDRLVGLISWRPQGTLKHGVAELARLVVRSDTVDPVAIKESLFDVMIAEADNYYRAKNSRLRKVYSMIHSDSKHIRQFYLDKGMQQEAVLHNHFHPGMDELVFSLFLS